MSLSKIAMSTTSMLNKNGNNRILYNFWRGHPNNDLLPVQEMQEILTMMCSPVNQESLRDSLQYLSSDRGDPTLLKEISLFLRRHTLKDELPEASTATKTIPKNDPSPPLLDLDMFLTHGVSHGLDLLCIATTKKDDVVLVERPTYFLAKNIFTSHSLRVQNLPMKKEPVTKTLMVDVEALGRGLKDGSIDVPRMIYIVPTHQNPTGNTMPLTDRLMLVKLARQYGIIVAADEVYHLLDWSSPSQRRPARFSVLDHLISKQSESITNVNVSSKNNIGRSGCSVSVSSFTKIFAPGVRCGWIEGPTSLIDSLVDVGYIQSQGGCVPFVGNILRTALAEGLQDRILDKLIMSYKDRSKLLCDILESESGIQIHHRPDGGYFLWVEFSSISSAEIFAGYCLDRGLKFMPGVRCDSVLEGFEQSGQPKELCQHSARLCFADMDTKDVSDGAKLLVKLYREYTGKL